MNQLSNSSALFSESRDFWTEQQQFWSEMMLRAPGCCNEPVLFPAVENLNAVYF